MKMRLISKLIVTQRAIERGLCSEFICEITSEMRSAPDRASAVRFDNFTDTIELILSAMQVSFTVVIHYKRSCYISNIISYLNYKNNELRSRVYAHGLLERNKVHLAPRASIVNYLI